jgi:hypothetical protein
LDTPEQTLEALRAICKRLSELSALHDRESKSPVRQHLEQRSGLAVISVEVSDPVVSQADGAKAHGSISDTFDGANLVFFTGPHSEDSLAASPLPHPLAPAPAPAAAATTLQRHNSSTEGDAAAAALAEVMAVVGCTRPEELLLSVEHLLVQSDELQHLRAVLSRRLDLTDPRATFVDAELGARHAQSASGAGSNRGSGIQLCDPDDVLLQDSGGATSGDNQLDRLESCAGGMQQSLAWDIVMHPARRPKPSLTSKPIAVRAVQAQPIQARERERKPSSQSKQQRSSHAEIGFSQQLFANFKRRLMSQRSAAASELLSVSRKQHSSGSGHNEF